MTPAGKSGFRSRKLEAISLPTPKPQPRRKVWPEILTAPLAAKPDAFAVFDEGPAVEKLLFARDPSLDQNRFKLCRSVLFAPAWGRRQRFTGQWWARAMRELLDRRRCLTWRHLRVFFRSQFALFAEIPLVARGDCGEVLLSLTRLFRLRLKTLPSGGRTFGRFSASSPAAAATSLESRNARNAHAPRAPRYRVTPISAPRS